MLVVMYKNATRKQIEKVISTIEKMGLVSHIIPGRSRVAIGVTGNTGRVDAGQIEVLPGVMEVVHITKRYKLTSIEMKPDRTVIEVDGIEIGGSRPVIIAGPCAVESHEQLVEIAQSVRDEGADMLRGGAYKPRSSPYAFQGLGLAGLKILADAKKRTGLPIVSEALNIETFSLVEKYVDIIQIGARNMQNVELLKRAGRSKRPILLKRGLSATLEELLLAAEYIMSEGNYNVILCERGIRTYNRHTRFTLDLGAIPVLRTLTHLPLLVDPSHAAGRRDLVLPLARAGLAVGSDGLIIEVHSRPEEALSDGPQALTPEMFAKFMRELGRDRHQTTQLIAEVY
ncbi:MAG: 3-deoxy-7-phosphoheptulonate synthase [Candidatus Thorarchaeota archaeon]|nr:3-deoxy-7-phosphoheptulonate synthase [Candidatus Thorarchaeota archaeon]